MFEQENFIADVKKAAHDGAKEGAKHGGGNALGANILWELIKLGILVGAIAAVIFFVLPKANIFGSVIDTIKDQLKFEDPADSHDLVLDDNGILGYTAADFAEVILGDSTQLKRLEVYSQEMSEMVTFTKTGLAKLKIFTKSKFYTYHGTATYTVDLSKLKEMDIKLDDEAKTVILTIPHAEMTDLNIPLEKMEIGDTSKGILAFGELNAKDSEQQEIYENAKTNMEEKLRTDNIQEKADRMAKLSVWEIYQPLIKTVSNGYTLEVVFR